jgi:hypothetical protein
MRVQQGVFNKSRTAKFEAAQLTQIGGVVNRKSCQITAWSAWLKIRHRVVTYRFYTMEPSNGRVPPQARVRIGGAPAPLFEGYGSLHPFHRVRVSSGWSLTAMMMTAVPFSHRHHTIQPEAVQGTLPVHSIR